MGRPQDCQGESVRTGMGERGISEPGGGENHRGQGGRDLRVGGGTQGDLKSQAETQGWGQPGENTSRGPAAQGWPHSP